MTGRAFNPEHRRHQIINGCLVELGQAEDGTWRYRPAPDGSWSRPFETLEAAEHAARYAPRVG